MRKLALTILVLLMVGISPVVSWAVDKILPIDYTEADRNSREIWFEFNSSHPLFGALFTDEDCSGLRTGQRRNVKIMRNGNALLSFNVPSEANEFLHLQVYPEKSLVAASGIKGLKFDEVVGFEFTQDIGKVLIKYTSHPRRNFGGCRHTA